MKLTEALERAGSPHADMQEVWEAHRYYIANFQKERKEREGAHYDSDR